MTTTPAAIADAFDAMHAEAFERAQGFAPFVSVPSDLLLRAIAALRTLQEERDDWKRKYERDDPARLRLLLAERDIGISKQRERGNRLSRILRAIADTVRQSASQALEQEKRAHSAAISLLKIHNELYEVTDDPEREYAATAISEALKAAGVDEVQS